MFVPARTNTGIVDLGDPETLLYYVNRAHRVFTTHCDRNAWLSLSSSEALMRRYLDDLTDAQVETVNNVLYTLGLRETKPGGGDSVIRADIYKITLEQLRANRRLPAATFADVTKEKVSAELVTAIALVIEGLQEVAEPVEGSPYGVALVRGHMAIIEEFAGELVGDVILALKRLDLYRFYVLGNDHVCFIQPGSNVSLTPEVVAQGRAQLEWPELVEELLPLNYLVAVIPPEQLIATLVRECERSREKYQHERRAREQAEAELAALGDEHDVCLAELEITVNRVAQLEAELDARSKAMQAAVVARVSKILKERIARILNHDGDVE